MSAWAMPRWGVFRAQSGLKWIDVQIFPPWNILTVLPSSSGSMMSGAAAGYVAGICVWGKGGKSFRIT